tara:strand:- start:2355 stop:2660 length:306 start_codon:yes stop_codon:yes gene_type:complete
MNTLLNKLENISKDKIDRVLSIQGFVINDYGKAEALEILIFRGFSSSTTHPTEIDLNNSTLPKNAHLEKAELLLGPIDPKTRKVIKSDSNLNSFINPKNWD